MKQLRLFLLLSLALLPGALQAQQLPGKAPLPTPLVTGKKVFVSNAGADSGLFPHPFSGDTARAYNELYAALASDKTFSLTSSPAEADLVFEIQLMAPKGPAFGDNQGAKVKGAADPLPMFRLVVYDRPTHYILWTFTESVDVAYLQKTHDRNFDDGIAALVNDLKTVVTPAP
jgi:hypothetical protein